MDDQRHLLVDKVIKLEDIDQELISVLECIGVPDTEKIKL